MSNRRMTRSVPLTRLPFRAPLTRRAFARTVLGGLGAVAVLSRCRGADASAAPSRDAGVTDGRSVRAACTVYPQETEGPYYLDLDLLRGDITEGRAGTPLSLAMEVVSAATCAPLKGVAVEVWHCDASGLYSGYPGQLGGVDTRGQTFLRGTQVTGEDGRVRFDTIYPGWYPGRTTHVHFKVHVSSTSVATSQMYFTEDLSAAIYRASPYAAHGQKDTSNAADSVARSGGGIPPLLAAAATTSGGYRAELTVAVAA